MLKLILVCDRCKDREEINLKDVSSHTLSKIADVPESVEWEHVCSKCAKFWFMIKDGIENYSGKEHQTETFWNMRLR